MIWFSVRQETAEVCGPRLINRIRGWAYLKCIRLSAHYRFIKFALDVTACVAVAVSGGWLLLHGNHESLANNRGNAIHFPRVCMAMFTAFRTPISFRTNMSNMTMLAVQLVCCIVCTFLFVFPSCLHSILHPCGHLSDPQH